MTDDELHYLADALKQISEHHREWALDYVYNKHTNEFQHKSETRDTSRIQSWFKLN
jgi:hypothetical protein